jgi:hypothetical protein
VTDAAPAPLFDPHFLSLVWRLTRPGAHAECSLYSHHLGWELRLVIGSSQYRRICRSHDELFDAAKDWKLAMQANGWRDSSQKNPSRAGLPPTPCYRDVTPLSQFGKTRRS